MNIIGVDVGKSGGIALISQGEIEPFKMPETVGDIADLLRSLAVRGPAKAYIELVHSSPQMGVVSAFSFGRGLGNLEACLQCCGIPMEWVRPQVWQKAIGCLTKGDKNVSKRKAQELFPHIKVTHAIADSMLIAEYGRRLNQ